MNESEQESEAATTNETETDFARDERLAQERAEAAHEAELKVTPAMKAARTRAANWAKGIEERRRPRAPRNLPSTMLGDNAEW